MPVVSHPSFLQSVLRPPSKCRVCGALTAIAPSTCPGTNIHPEPVTFNTSASLACRTIYILCPPSSRTSRRSSPSTVAGIANTALPEHYT
ncbi:unnamed protein product [Schistosoma curassoni]|uniref:Secreted protein n=1 Tax=Schistosoma curassoni TaxID=6186 RepID=A0A183JGR0_9TREM|nr:unnamed protein product [Schistosoma curassoni]